MAHDLVALAFDDPVRAEGLALRFIESAVSPDERAIGHQALGISLRDQGHIEEALARLKEAVSCAERAHDDDLLADVLGTSGVTLVAAGHPRRGLSQLDKAIALRPTPRALAARAYALVLQGRYEAAYRDNRAALDGFRSVGDVAWEARSLHSLGWTEMSWGRLDEAEEHTRAAAELLRSVGLELEALWSEQNLGEIAYARGDLPAALRVFEVVSGEYDRLGVSPAHLATVRAQTCLAAGLVDEAVEVIQEALARTDVIPMDRGILELMGGVGPARRRIRSTRPSARRARPYGRLSRFGEDWFSTRARLVVVRACARRGDRGRRLAAEAPPWPTCLDARGADEAPVALIVASRLDDGRRYRAADPRRDVHEAADRPHAGQRLAGPGPAPGSCAQTVEGSCVRVDAGWTPSTTTGGCSAAPSCARSRPVTAPSSRRWRCGTRPTEPRDLLRWSERWRSTALAQTPVTPGDAPGPRVAGGAARRRPDG